MNPAPQAANRHLYRVEVERRGTSDAIRVDGEMTIYNAAGLKDRLLAGDAGADIELDLRQVSELDTAGLQLLVLLRRRAQAGGRAFSVRCASDAVRDALAVFGVADLPATSSREPRP